MDAFDDLVMEVKLLKNVIVELELENHQLHKQVASLELQLTFCRESAKAGANALIDLMTKSDDTA